MRYLKTNTATIVTVGPFIDVAGLVLETGLTITNERISFVVDLNDGSAPTLVLDNVTGATSATANDLNYITNCDAGLMQLELAAANVNYLGRAFLTITDAANHCPVFHEFTILPAMVFDSLIAGTDVLQADMTQILGTAVSAPATAGVLDINLKNIANAAVATGSAQLGVNVVTQANIDFGATQKASITTAASAATPALSAGGVTAVQSGLATAAALTIIDDFLDTEVAAILAAVDTEVAAIKTKTDFLPSVTAGAAGGVFIAGANAATSVTTALTANITGNLSGSVGSVTGAVGSVTGAVGSVTGAVGSVAANGITATSIAADAINAAAVKADAVTKIQNGLATPTNITAGTITTVTNLTNAPTNGDLTATMKTSVTTAATAATPIAASVTGAVGSVTGLTAADVGAIKTTIGVAGAGLTALGDTRLANLDATVSSRNATTPPTVGAIADQVWDEPMAGHSTASTAGALLIDIIEDTSTTIPLAIASIGTIPATSAIADAVWDEALSGHSTAGTAGKKLTDLANADLSGVATSTALATLAGYVDTEVASILAAVDTEIAAILADTNELQTDWHDGGRLDLLLDAAGGAGTPPTVVQIRQEMDANSTQLAAIVADTNEIQLELVDGGRLDLLIDAIKAKTDTLPASPAAVGSAMTLTEPYDAAKTAATQASIDDLAADVAAVKAKTDLISTAGAVTVVSPVASGGEASVYQGDDYHNTDGRALAWSSDAWPDLTGATIALLVKAPDGTVLFSVAGAAVDPGSATQTARVELTAAQTATLAAWPGPSTLRVRATLASGRIVTLVDSTLEAIEELA